MSAAIQAVYPTTQSSASGFNSVASSEKTNLSEVQPRAAAIFRFFSRLPSPFLPLSPIVEFITSSLPRAVENAPALEHKRLTYNREANVNNLKPLQFADLTPEDIFHRIKESITTATEQQKKYPDIEYKTWLKAGIQITFLYLTNGRGMCYNRAQLEALHGFANDLASVEKVFPVDLSKGSDTDPSLRRSTPTTKDQERIFEAIRNWHAKQPRFEECKSLTGEGA